MSHSTEVDELAIAEARLYSYYYKDCSLHLHPARPERRLSLELLRTGSTVLPADDAIGCECDKSGFCTTMDTTGVGIVVAVRQARGTA
jgi:hypothetical protein